MSYKGFAKSGYTTIPINSSLSVEKTGKGILKTIGIAIDGSSSYTGDTHLVVKIDGVTQIDMSQGFVYQSITPQDWNKLPFSAGDLTLAALDPVTDYIFRFRWKVNLPFTTSAEVLLVPPTDISGVDARILIDGIEEV